jgi:hypothetical protein
MSMLRIERSPVHVDKDTWFYVNRKSIFMVHWQDFGGQRVVSTFRVPTKTLRRVLLILAMQSGKEKARRQRRRAKTGVSNSAQARK